MRGVLLRREEVSVLKIFIAYSARWQLKGSVTPGAFPRKTFGVKVGTASPGLLVGVDQRGEMMLCC